MATYCKDLGSVVMTSLVNETFEMHFSVTKMWGAFALEKLLTFCD